MRNILTILILFSLITTASAVCEEPSGFFETISCSGLDIIKKGALASIGVEATYVNSVETYTFKEDGTIGIMRDKIGLSPSINDQSYPVLNELRNRFVYYLLAPLFTVVWLWLGLNYIIQSDSPQGRARSKDAIKKLVIGMIVVLISGEIFQLLTDLFNILSAMALSLNPDIEQFASIVALVAPFTALFFWLVSVLATVAIYARNLLMLVLGTIFPITLACYFIDIDVVNSLGRKLMGVTVAVLFSQFLMALIFAISIMAAGSIDVAQDPGGSAVALFMALAGFVGVAIAPLISLGVVRMTATAGAVAGAGGTVAGGTLSAAGILTGQPAVAAAGGILTAASSGVSGVSSGIGKLSESVGDGVTGIAAGITAAGSQMPAIAQNYRSETGRAATRPPSNTGMILPDTATPAVGPNMAQQIPNANRSYQGVWQQLATAEVMEENLRADDPELGNKLFDACVQRGAGPSFDGFNLMDPEMRKRNLKWTRGNGSPGEFFEKEIVTNMLACNAWGVDDDGHLFANKSSQELVERFGGDVNLLEPSKTRFEPSADFKETNIPEPSMPVFKAAKESRHGEYVLRSADRGNFTLLELVRSEDDGSVRTKTGWVMKDEKPAEKLKGDIERGADPFADFNRMAETRGGYLAGGPVTVGEVTLENPVVRDVITADGRVLEVYMQPREDGSSDVLVRPKDDKRMEDAKHYRVPEGDPMSRVIEAEADNADPQIILNQMTEKGDVELEGIRVPENIKTERDLMVYISENVEKEKVITHFNRRGLSLEADAGWEEIIDQAVEEKKISKKIFKDLVEGGKSR